jgi:hypothetical protein
VLGTGDGYVQTTLVFEDFAHLREENKPTVAHWISIARAYRAIAIVRAHKGDENDILITTLVLIDRIHFDRIKTILTESILEQLNLLPVRCDDSHVFHTNTILKMLKMLPAFTIAIFYLHEQESSLKRGLFQPQIHWQHCILWKLQS